MTPQLLSVFHPEYAIGTIEVISPVDAVSVALAEGGTIRGKVTLDGKPAAGIRVYLRYAERHASSRIETKTESDGTYHLSKGIPGQTTVVASGGEIRGPWFRRNTKSS